MPNRFRLPSPVELSHWFIQRHVLPGEFCELIDATVGNGQDTCFLARHAGTGGRVIGFDVQQQALDTAQALVDNLEIAESAEVELLLQGHETLATVLEDRQISRIDGAMFNLGYLPRGDKSRITQAETTLAALTQAEQALAPGGVITVVLYTGHTGGEEEAAAVRAHAEALAPTEFDVAHWHCLGARDMPPPELLVIIRRSSVRPKVSPA